LSFPAKIVLIAPTNVITWSNSRSYHDSEQKLQSLYLL